MGRLYLDGVNDLTRKLEEYDVDNSKRCCEIKKDVWLRITILAHTVLTWFRTIIVQFLRGTSNLCAGVIHLDKDRVTMALNDYCSLLIQAIALPIIGVITFIFPRAGYHLLHAARRYFDAPRQVEDLIYTHEIDSKESFHEFREGLAEAIMGVFGSISAFIQTITISLEYLLSLNFEEAHETILNTGKLIYISTKEGVSNCLRNEISKQIFSAHRIAVQSFNPSALVD